MITRQDFITALTSLVGGSLPLGETEQIFAINKAVKKYSRDRPFDVIEDESGSGAFDYALTLLASWNEKFSSIKKVEYPVDDTAAIPPVLADDAWTMYKKPAGPCLRFLEDKPMATETMRITYTALLWPASSIA